MVFDGTQPPLANSGRLPSTPPLTGTPLTLNSQQFCPQFIIVLLRTTSEAADIFISSPPFLRRTSSDMMLHKSQPPSHPALKSSTEPDGLREQFKDYER